MKRTALITALVTLASTIAVALGSPASADVECRYKIYPPPYLAPDVPQSFTGSATVNPALWRTIRLQQPRWSVLAVRPFDADYDLLVHQCPSDPLATSALGGNAVDFIALDGNRAWSSLPETPVDLFATVDRYGTTNGTFTVQYSTGSSLAPGYAHQLIMSRTPAVIRDLYVPGGSSARVTLRTVDGDADLFLVASGTDPASWARSRIQASMVSANPGTQPESLTVSVSPMLPGMVFGVVVVNNSASGHYWLVRE